MVHTPNGSPGPALPDLEQMTATHTPAPEHTIGNKTATYIARPENSTTDSSGPSTDEAAADAATAPDPSQTAHGAPTLSCTPAQDADMREQEASSDALFLGNGQHAPLSAVPVFSYSAFSIWMTARVREGCRVVSLFAVPLPLLQRRARHDTSGAQATSTHTACAKTMDATPANTGDTGRGTNGTHEPGSPAAADTHTLTACRLFAVLASDATGKLLVIAADVTGSYPSLTPRVPQLHLFERAIYEQYGERYGLRPEGHPWLKPVRFPTPTENCPPRKTADLADSASLSTPASTPASSVGKADFFEVTGDEVHEVAVGPIHAGVIECGHFRFQCLGEEVLHLEISLGYHHRGVQELILGGPNTRTLPLMEAVAGDESIAHAFAYCTAMESLSGSVPSPRGQIIRALALELERLANHTGDMGALAGDIGFLTTSAFCGRLRGDWLNMTALLCGSRFGRGLIVPGGTAFDLTPEIATELRKRIVTTARDVEGALKLAWDAPSVMARLTAIGPVTQEQAVEIGLVGPAARSCGLARDQRHTHPLPGVPSPPPMCLTASGDDNDVSDVRSRAALRSKEIAESVAYCLHLIDDFLHPSDLEEAEEPAGYAPASSTNAPSDANPERNPVISTGSEFRPHDTMAHADIATGTDHTGHTAAGAHRETGMPLENACAYALAPLSLCVTLVEAWRGELCHVAVTGHDGRFAAYEITDPSFHNWLGLALALRNQQISDFPLCNKSFNLSYCGHDL